MPLCTNDEVLVRVRTQGLWKVLDGLRDAAGKREICMIWTWPKMEASKRCLETDFHLPNLW